MIAEQGERGPGLALSHREFTLFQELIHREAGIWLAPIKKTLLVGRLSRRLRELELRSFAAYFRVVKADEAERVRMLDCVCTNETHFFREPRHFELLETRLIAEWQAEADAGERPKRVNVWSAACSSGEEPYSLAMSLLERLPPGSGWDVQVLASDLSTRVLERAKEGIWPADKVKEIPARHLKAFMLRGVGPREGKIAAGPEIRQVVRFSRVNLNEARWPVRGPFDAIFCRNVLIYFDAELKRRVVSRLLEQLAPGGYLFLGHAESLIGITGQAGLVSPTVYRVDPRRRTAPSGSAA